MVEELVTVTSSIVEEEVKVEKKFVPVELKRNDYDKHGKPMNIYKINRKNTNKYSPQKRG